MPIMAVKEIADQLRVQAMLAKTTTRRRRVFDALANYYEHTYEVHEKAHHSHEEGDGIGGAVRALLDNFDYD